MSCLICGLNDYVDFFFFKQFDEKAANFLIFFIFSPPPETGENFECKSVMYYYNEQECILNVETRENKPDLFISEGEEFQVRILKLI